MGREEREQWDAIVIGSGLGGLVCAAYLCAAGKRTLVLEAHYIAGGNSQVFRRRRGDFEYEFDVGVHYIGECGPDGLITRIYNALGLAERVVFRPLDPDGFTTMHFPDLTFRVPVGWDRYLARLVETFPDQAEALTRVIETLRQVATEGRAITGGELANQELAEKAPTFMQWGLRPVTELFAAHGLSQRVCGVMLGEQGDHAVRPSRTPVALHAGIADHFLRGAFHPEGGGQVMAGRLVEAIRAYGGEVRTRAPVARVRVEKGRVAGVALAKTNQEIDAPIVVSNADLKRTVHTLVGDEHFQPETLERVRAYRMSLGLFVVYLGLDVDLRARGFSNCNHVIVDTYDFEGIYDRLEAGEFADKAATFVTIASTKDPENPRVAPRGCTNLQLMTVAPRGYDVWEVDQSPTEGGRYHRDPEYRSRKVEAADRLITATAKVIPDIHDHIAWQETATPVTQERFTRSTGGTSYGIEMAVDQIGPMRMGPSTDVPGLYLCGASCPPGAGIAGVMRSGIAAAGAVLETDLMRLVRTGEVLGDRGLLPELRDDWDPWRECH